MYAQADITKFTSHPYLRFDKSIPVGSEGWLGHIHICTTLALSSNARTDPSPWDEIETFLLSDSQISFESKWATRYRPFLRFQMVWRGQRLVLRQELSPNPSRLARAVDDPRWVADDSTQQLWDRVPDSRHQTFHPITKSFPAEVRSNMTDVSSWALESYLRFA